MHALKAGGVETVMNRLSRFMAGSGHNVHILTLSKDDHDLERAKTIRDHGITLHQLNIKHTNPLRYAVIPLILIYFFMRNRDFDRIIIPGIVNAIMCIPFIKLLFIKSRIIVNAHTAFSAYYETTGKAKRLFFALGRWILPLADVTGNDSQGAADDLADHFKLDKVHALYNPVATDDDLAFKAEKNDAPHIWLKDDALTTFVTCGRLVEMKNNAHMIRVFSRMVASNYKLRLILIGTGPQQAALEKLTDELNIKDFVSFEGFVDDPKLYFYHADYFWLSSKFEGFSMVLGEALAMGIPCITNDCPFGPAEVIDKGKFGLLLPNYNEIGNAKTILEFLQTPIQSKAYYRSRAQEFLVSKIAQLYLTI